MAVHAVCTGTDVGRQITQAMREIRRIHDVGTELLSCVGPAGSGGNIAAAAEARGLEYDDACRYRQFADPNGGFTAGEIDELERLCDEHGHVPGTAMLESLIRVQDRELRRELTEDAARQHWSIEKLSIKIRKRQPRRRAPGGGRPPKVADDVPGLLRQIEQYCTAWTRWAAKAEEGGPLDELPRHVRQRLDTAVRSMRGLLDAVAAELP